MGSSFSANVRCWTIAAQLGLAVVVAGSIGCARQPHDASSVDVSTEEVSTEPVVTRAEVDKAVATTGDLVLYSVTIDHQPGLEISIAEPGAEIAGFRIVDLGRDDRELDSGRLEQRRWYQLRADLVGSYVLPPVRVSYRAVESTEAASEDAVAEESAAEDSVTSPPLQGAVETSPIFVEVESVLPADGEAQDIRGLKPIQRVERIAPWWWIAAGAGGLVLLAAGWWIWRRRRTAADEPKCLPHEIAFEQLAALRRTEFSDPEAVRRFYFDVSEVVRAYVEGRFRLNATDLTTEEIVHQLGAVDASDSQRGALRSFLIATDEVKFAHRAPTEQEIESVYETALSFVEETRPRASETDADTAASTSPPPPANPKPPTSPNPPATPEDEVAA